MIKKMTRAQMAKEMNARGWAIAELTKRLADAERAARESAAMCAQLGQDLAAAKIAIKPATAARIERLTRNIADLNASAEHQKQKLSAMTSRNQSLLAQIGKLNSELAIRNRLLKKFERNAAVKATPCQFVIATPFSQLAPHLL